MVERHFIICGMHTAGVAMAQAGFGAYEYFVQGPVVICHGVLPISAIAR
jgi:hypothetical protein